MITRRVFLIAGGVMGSGVLVRLAGSSGALAPIGGGTFESGCGPTRFTSQPVVAFFDGQLWLDTSGASVAYRPPTAAPAVPAFTDEELLRTRGYI